jgi:hypothetical protein
MQLNIQRKGKKLVLRETELHQFMEAKLGEISSLGSSVVMALIMITLLSLLLIFKAGDIYIFLLVLLPLAGRVYVGDIITKWLRKKFQGLIGI